MAAMDGSSSAAGAVELNHPHVASEAMDASAWHGDQRKRNFKADIGELLRRRSDCTNSIRLFGLT
jgi:hypothetical protein